VAFSSTRQWRLRIRLKPKFAGHLDIDHHPVLGTGRRQVISAREHFFAKMGK
jgi:hypothetical protein